MQSQSCLYKKPIIETIVAEMKSASTSEIDYVSELTKIIDGVTTSYSTYDLSGIYARKIPGTLADSKLEKVLIHFNNPNPREGFLWETNTSGKYYFVELKKPKCSVYKIENNEIKEQYFDCLTILEIRENLRTETGGGTGAVTSVNEQTGDVVLTAEDIETTTTHTTIQANLERIDERIDAVDLTPENLAEVIVGSDEIVVDENPDDLTQLQVRLDQDVLKAVKVSAVSTSNIGITTSDGNTIIAVSNETINPDKHIQLMFEIEGAGIHYGGDCILHPATGDNVCFSMGRIDVNGSFKDFTATMDADGGVNIIIIGAVISDITSSNIKIHYLELYDIN